ncbi:hypothetical protein [Nocardia aurantia]|uniref:Uncharacterized protein n=1 Tax=Nocardia aurantia TaxID=2585199 RepID=A0A7K0DUX6_9NOCA|nr:hypothetical protein [Nocardia aurantia]MQY29563.1 hypothetical protein [Nocardia aurantia]
MPGEHLSEEPQAERGPEGSRDTGADTPGGGPADRPAGTIDEEETTSSHDREPAPGTVGTTGTETPGDAEPAVPPYEGRTGADR